MKPEYELQAKNHGPDDLEFSIWQLPGPASPHLKERVRIAGIKGRNLSLIEGHVLRLLKRAGVYPDPKRGEAQKFNLDEEIALNLGLLCKIIAPMRNAERMRQVLQGIGQMDQPEAAYWLGMAMHRKNPRRVLSALRLLLTEPIRAN